MFTRKQRLFFTASLVFERWKVKKNYDCQGATGDKNEHVTSHKKTFLTVCRFGTDSCVYAVYKPFERLGLSVRKNLHPFAPLRLSVQKKFASIRTAWAICAKNIVIRSKKIDICSNGSSYPFKTIIIISRRFHLSCSRLGRSGRSHATNLSKNVNDLMQALC